MCGSALLVGRNREKTPCRLSGQPRGASKPAEHRAGDLALEALERLRDGLDVLDLGSVPARDEDRASRPAKRRHRRPRFRAPPACRRSRRRNCAARFATGSETPSSSEAPADAARSPRRRAAKARGRCRWRRAAHWARHGSAPRPDLRLRIDPEERGEPGPSQVCVDEKGRHRHLRERQREVGGEIGRADPRMRARSRRKRSCPGKAPRSPGPSGPSGRLPRPR